ncbi:unnamed protein product [marine sediment metagenome]|uniref:Uncharacterized protein n=1 Tax=marine sediment metagenome TaxID=412755 RepID=X1E1L0_9ZZZZ
MANTYEMQLHSLLTLVHHEARLAYWKNEKHCGSDFDPQSGCVDCQHFRSCEIMHSIDAGLTNLDQMGGD